MDTAARGKRRCGEGTADPEGERGGPAGRAGAPPPPQRDGATDSVWPDARRPGRGGTLASLGSEFFIGTQRFHFVRGEVTLQL